MGVKMSASILSDKQFYIVAAVLAVGGYVAYRKIAVPIEAVAETVVDAADYVTGGEDEANFIARAVGSDTWGTSVFCWLNKDALICQDENHVPGAVGISAGAG